MRGITRGLQLVADFFAIFLQAVEKANAAAIADGVSIARQWLRETVDEAGAVKVSGWGLVFGNSDPWRDSRKMQQAYSAKWRGKI